MAEEPWNKVNIPFPSAVSTVRIPFNISTDALVQQVLRENEKVLKLLRSKVLQTEIRILYELLFVLNNSLRQHKPFRIIKQVEQCINRVKQMKLDAALQDLKELCPNKIQRQMALDCGLCDIPSQPTLEWLCLKVLGAARLTACLLGRCTGAVMLVRQHLRSKEFILLNVVFTSVLSRLWVFFRGILGRLSPLYQGLLDLLKEVSKAQSVPFLTDFQLPAGMAEFLGPSDSCLLEFSCSAKGMSVKGASGSSVLRRLFRQEGVANRRQAVGGPSNRTGKKVDLGTAVLRRSSGEVSGIDLKALLKQTMVNDTETSMEKVQPSSVNTSVNDQKRSFLKQLRTPISFSKMATHLEEVMQWCHSRKLWRGVMGRLKFLHLKCRRMKHLESEGFRVQGKLRRFKQEVSWALNLGGNIPITCLPLKTLWRRAHPRTCVQYTKNRSAPIRTADSALRKTLPRPDRGVSNRGSVGGGVTMTGPLLRPEPSDGSSSLCDTAVQKPSNMNQSDIDAIFASIGF
ncbi:hypothetical protein DPEC_G00137370 [Dallia pectoralis]|uniref:Uncharacterized protein n=1 Tax=Dallia pectoralis TaxID=75939 RepID=A0ACC2GLB9_DALPE|nr:hypothetical protein DPEC_G00137370 [Dallia pectoralis]